MKFLIRLFLLTGLFICVQQYTNAQDLFTKFQGRINAQKPKSEQPTSNSKLKKNKWVGKVLNESTVNYSSVSDSNPSIPFDTIPKKRLSERKRELFSDSIKIINNNSDITNLFIQDSIPKKKKKKKSEELNFQSDSTSTQQELNIDKTPESQKDTMPVLPQVIYMDSAYEFLSENKFIEAITYYDKVIGNFPATEEYKFAFLWRAKARSELEDFAGALHDLDIFISMDNCGSNWCSESYYQRGLVNFNLQNFQNSITDFSKVLNDTAYSNFKYCYFYRAFCMGESEKYIQAVQDYTKFLNLDKFKSVSSAEALYYRGFYKVKLNDNRGAISDYDMAIEMYSGAYESSKEKNQTYFQKLIDTYITRGLAYAEIKKWDDAIINYNTVIKMKPDYATAFHLKGLAEIGKGDLDAGCLDLSRAGELGSIDAYDDIKLHCK